MKKQEYRAEVGGKTLHVIFSDLASKANGSVMLSMEDTVVLATATMSKDKRDGIDFFPLTVDYEERFYASGKILGSRFVRREGKPSDTAILSGRMVDRAIRPLFDHDLRHEVQIVITVLSIGDSDPDVLALNAASIALATSDIPWGGPVSAVRIGSEAGGEFSVNPPFSESKDDILDLVAAGKDGNINMIEAGGREISEINITRALTLAVKEIENLESFQKKIIGERGVPKKIIEKSALKEEVVKIFKNEIAPQIEKVVFSKEAGWHHIEKLKDHWLSIVKEKIPDESRALAAQYYENAINDALKEGALEKNIRADGRGFNEIRQIEAEAGGISEKLHGTGIFYRGETHVLSVLTLGGPDEAQLIDGIEVKEKKRFMHHYNFPPFSSGETGRIGGTNRREVGHGALAEKALIPVLPSETEFPYTLRIVSESMSSNGSTSMASVCASSLALMDGGVPITRPVAGIALGLVYGKTGKYKILLDIQGPEDHHGDMDFKVAGTRSGITAIQLDVKVEGVPVNVLSEALNIAREGRVHILDMIERAMPKPREGISPFAPRVLIAKINTEKIGTVIGPGGKTINGIKDKTGAEEINIAEDGIVTIVGRNGSAEKVLKAIEELTHEHKKGERFEGRVTRILDFGAFVEFAPGAEGLVHISEIAPFRIEKVSDAVSVGEKVPVVIKEIDMRGRINLSIREADPEFAAKKGLSGGGINK
ncbi:MAG: polyribonucleotide nucleotidyltransferase [Patescibacteria group bacterium]